MAGAGSFSGRGRGTRPGLDPGPRGRHAAPARAPDWPPMRRLILPLLLLSACVPAGPEPPPYWWKLVSIDGQPFAAEARIAFQGDRGDRIIGQAPCNSFSARVVKDPFPTVRFVDIVATEMACDDLPAETEFFAALSQMTGEGVGIGYLTLLNDAGRRMEFRPTADPTPAQTQG